MDEQKCETLAVAICDDEPEILKQLQRLAQSALDGTPAVFYAAGQPQSLLMEKRSFDIAILDIRFPGFSGIELAKWLLGRNPLCQILFVSSFPTYVSDVYDVPHLVMILKDQIQAQLPKYLRRAVQNLWASGSVKLVSADTVRVYAAAQIVCLERNGRVTRVTMSCVKFALLTAMEMRLGLSVSWMAVLMMQPLSLAPSRAVRMNRP